MIGCSEGFFPQENKTANCVASDQWSLSTEEIMCVEVDTKQQGKYLSMHGADNML